jgi:hypothetical protein
MTRLKEATMKSSQLSDTGHTHRHGERPHRTLTALLGGAVCLFVLAPACDEFGPRVYTAQRHAVDPGCLEAYAPIGLVEAQAVSALCEPVCLSLGEDLYVSTLCPPYPAEASVEPEDSEGCTAALAAPLCDDPIETPDAAAP